MVQVYSDDDDVLEDDEEAPGLADIKKPTKSENRRRRTVQKETRSKVTSTTTISDVVLTPSEDAPEPSDFDYLEILINGANVEAKADVKGPEDEERAAGTARSRGPREKAKPRFDRALRLAARHCHLSSLLVAYSRKSLFLGTPILKAEALSRVPPHLLRQFSPEIIADGRTFLNALSMLANWWKNSTKCLNGGCREGPRPEEGPRHDVKLRKVAETRLGTAEDLVAVFVVILRSLGLKTRYVCSLQPVLVHPVPHSDELSAGPEATKKEDQTSLRKTMRQTVPGGVSITRVSTNASPTKERARASLPPRFWCEVLHPREGRWIVVDCLRGIVNDRLAMEPPPLANRHLPHYQHLFSIAYDERGRAVDVSRRYASRFYGVTAKLRRHDEMILTEVLSLLGGLVSGDEEEELASLVDGEPLPTTVAGFHGHGRYMLESQLKKYEVFWPPDAGIVGEFRGVPVRLRAVVQKVRSKEAWYTQFGRVIIEGEAPCKHVALPKKPERKSKKVADWEKPLEEVETHSAALKEAVLQPLFGEWQTEPFAPPVAVDGKVPRNKFGNVDLYLPSMLPIGCVWINDDSAHLAAHDLGVDYAAACVRFAFSGRFAVPNLRGIVICAEYEGAVLRRLEEMRAEIEEARRQAEIERDAKRARLERKKQKIREKILGERGGLNEPSEGAGPDASAGAHIVSALASKSAANNAEDADFDTLF